MPLRRDVAEERKWKALLFDEAKNINTSLIFSLSRHGSSTSLRSSAKTSKPVESDKYTTALDCRKQILIYQVRLSVADFQYINLIRVTKREVPIDQEVTIQIDLPALTVADLMYSLNTYFKSYKLQSCC